MQIEIIRDINQLAALREAWNQAVAQSSFDSVFASHEWFFCWAQHFISDDQLFVVIAREDDALLGIMPLVLEQHRQGTRSHAILRSMTNLQTYKYNFIVHQDRASTVLAAMFQHISRNLAWSDIILDFVPEPASTLSVLETLQDKSIYRIRSEFHMDSPYVQIEGSWEDYLHSRDKKVRKNWDYFERKLDKAGRTGLVSIHADDNLAEQIDRALEIEQASWKGDKGTAIANSRDETGFYHDLAEAMSQRGQFSLHFLTLNDEPIAFDYCLTHKDQYNVLKTGYDPAYSKDSPGRVLRKKVLRSLYQDGRYKVYDLLGARDPWKMEWCDTTQPLLHVHIYNFRAAAMLGYAMAQSVDWFKQRLYRHPHAYHAVKAVYLWLMAIITS